MRKKCGTLRIFLFSTRGNAEIKIQRLFSDNKTSTPKIVVSKIQMASACFGAYSMYKIVF
jgi:hypothetical protein